MQAADTVEIFETLVDSRRLRYAARFMQMRRNNLRRFLAASRDRYRPARPVSDETAVTDYRRFGWNITRDRDGSRAE